MKVIQFEVIMACIQILNTRKDACDVYFHRSDVASRCLKLLTVFQPRQRSNFGHGRDARQSIAAMLVCRRRSGMLLLMETASVRVRVPYRDA